MKPGKYSKQKKRLPFWYYAAVVLLTGVFVFSGWYLIDYFAVANRQADVYEDLASMVDSHKSDIHADQPGETMVIDGDFEMMVPTPVENLRNADGILLEYAQLYEMNPDVAGWICIEGTKINYPVMHTPDRANYYLKRDFYGAYSSWGCIYAREECDLELPSDNVTLYGHNMKDGSMFAALNDYGKKEFWKQHPYIRFDTIREHHTYAIFAVFTTTASQGLGFEYHAFVDAAEEQAFAEFIETCLALSLYDTGIVPAYGDKIICLSTCEYTQTNGRLVVAAVRMD